MSSNEYTEPSATFAGTLFGSLNKSDMESGQPLTLATGFISNTTDPFTMIPTNISGASAPSALPPSGTSNYFLSESWTSSFAYEVRKFTPGTRCGGGGSLSAPVNVSQTSYSRPGGNIVPQPSPATSSNSLDSLGDRLMQKVQYRKVGTAESLWVVHSVQTSSSSTVRPEWAQIDVSGGAIATSPIQEQIYAPDTTLYRWMGSIAADHAGNAALGYSTSNASSPNFPGIAYSGRLITDPLNNLSQTETQLISGVGSQTNCDNGNQDTRCRWGDYTAMSVDPSDDCTFWYTSQYYSSQANGSGGNWQTRIGSFKFPTCSSAAPNLTPFQPSGWSDKIVVSNTTTDTFYIDWAVINNGTAPTGATFFTKLYVDGIERNTWFTDPPLNINFNAFVQDYSIGSLGAGTHTIKISADTTGAIAESDESDNEYTKSITVNPAPTPTPTPTPCPITLTVNDNGDASDASPGNGVCATAGGVCTLRAAIEEANARSSCGTIDINFSGVTSPISWAVLCLT
jgi:hypothetical protein